jgi:hypothetical protein
MFIDIAQPFIKIGMPVFPLAKGTKIPPVGFHFKEEATTDQAQIEKWNATDSSYNVAIYLNGAFCALEFDIKGGMTSLCNQLGREVPKTRSQISAGKRCGHFIFKSTDYSRRIGNRSANLPEGGEWFSFRQNGKYLVGAGSVLAETGRRYETKDDVEPTEIPDWLVNAIAERTKSHEHSVGDKPQLAEDFDMDDFIEWYEVQGAFSVQRIDSWDGKPIYVTDECIIAGHKHRGSEATGFVLGDNLGYHCFSQDCEGQRIGDVLRKLNESYKPYPQRIWEEKELDFAALNVEELEAGEAAVTSVAEQEEMEQLVQSDETISVENFKTLFAGEEVPQFKINPAVVPTKLKALPEECLYGWLGGKARELEMPLGYTYPAIVTAFAGHNIMQMGNVRPTLYTCLIGPVHSGKSVAADRAVKSLNYGRSDAVKTTTPGSDRGLYNLFGVKKQKETDKCEILKTHILVQDELRDTFGKISVQGSSLAPTLCKLWSLDEAGSADKQGEHTVHVRLSILGALKAKDATDFARVFGSATNDGLYDRFVYGIIPKGWEYEDWSPKPEGRRPKGTSIPRFCYEMVKEWRSEGRKVGLDRGRLGEIALRWALITASANHDSDITLEGMEKALLFCEWQENIRSTYKAGVSDTLDGQCMGAVLDAFEKLEGKAVKFSDLAKRKNWYRDFHTSLGRVRQVLINDGMLVEETKSELDAASGKDKEKKTGRVFMPLGNV